MADNENFQGALGGLILAVKSNGEEFTFMQYTGLKEMNGVEIYEGDIWEFNDSRFTVEFEDGRPGYYPFASDDGCGCCSSDTYYSSSGEVIGNIYENPELLEEMS